jgi:hypothetical protein
MSQNRVNKILIGTDIDRTAALVLYGSGCNIANGEVVVLDKNLDVLGAGQTVADSDTIYIAVGTGDTYDYTTEAGVSVTGVRKLRVSSPIKGGLVKSYKGVQADNAPVQRQATLAIESTAFVPVVGTEYVMRVIYRDITEHPGQFVQDFRHVATTATPQDLVDALRIAVNTNPNSRIVASENAATDLVITGKPIVITNDIDEYSIVDFEVTFFSGDYVKGANEAAVTITYNTKADAGDGNPLIIKDREKKAYAYEGIASMKSFPFIHPDTVTSESTWYDSIIIESDIDFLSSDNQYVKRTAVTTEVYLPVNALQTADLLAQLNPWMASVNQPAVIL